MCIKQALNWIYHGRHSHFTDSGCKSLHTVSSIASNLLWSDPNNNKFVIEMALFLYNWYHLLCHIQMPFLKTSTTEDDSCTLIKIL